MGHVPGTDEKETEKQRRRAGLEKLFDFEQYVSLSTSGYELQVKLKKLMNIILTGINRLQ